MPSCASRTRVYDGPTSPRAMPNTAVSTAPKPTARRKPYVSIAQEAGIDTIRYTSMKLSESNPISSSLTP